VVERQEAAVKFLVPHQQLSESIEPTVCHLDNPASGLFPRVTFEFVSFLSPPFDMRNVVVLLDDFQGWSSGVARVGTQVLVSSLGWTGSLNHDGIKYRL